MAPPPHRGHGAPSGIMCCSCQLTSAEPQTRASSSLHVWKPFGSSLPPPPFGALGPSPAWLLPGSLSLGPPPTATSRCSMSCSLYLLSSCQIHRSLSRGPLAKQGLRHVICLQTRLVVPTRSDATGSQSGKATHVAQRPWCTGRRHGQCATPKGRPRVCSLTPLSKALGAPTRALLSGDTCSVPPGQALLRGSSFPQNEQSLGGPFSSVGPPWGLPQQEPVAQQVPLPARCPPRACVCTSRTCLPPHWQVLEGARHIWMLSVSLYHFLGA